MSTRKGRSKPRRLVLESLESRRMLAFDPSGMEQQFLQLANRFRTDPQNELGRLVSQISPVASSDPQIDLNLKFWKTDGNELTRQWQGLTPVSPLAWHESLYNAAHGHNQKMIANHDQQHQFPGEPDAGQRMRDAGYSTRAWGENIAAYCTTINECHASYVLDWGPGPNGIQSPPKHREILLSANYREVGIGVTPHAKANQSDVGPLVNTQDFSNRSNFGNPFVVGAVFNDANSSTWYENGEGLGGATIKFVGLTGIFTTTSMTAGGYQIQLPAGVYIATATGGGLRETLTFAAVVVGTNNVWLNFRQDKTALPGDRFEPNNDFDTATQIAAGDTRVETVSIHLPDNDDVYKWTSQATGEMKIDLTFRNQDGNLNLYLYNDARAQVAAAEGSTDNESITFQVTAGSVWYIGVKGAQRSTNSNYTLNVNGPGGTVPNAADDKTATNKNAPIVLDILANDTDADGDLDRTSVQISTQPQHGTIAVNPQTGAITYTPVTDFLGVERFNYIVRDSASLASRAALVTIAVVDYSNRPWRNPKEPMDIDASGAVVPQDALVIINRLNERGPGPLPPRPTGSDSPPGFFDPSGDDFLSSIDALRVINFLNQRAAEGERVAEAAVIHTSGVFAADASSDAESAKTVDATGPAADLSPQAFVVAMKSRCDDVADEVFHELGQPDTSLEELLAEPFPGIK